MLRCLDSNFCAEEFSPHKPPHKWRHFSFSVLRPVPGLARFVCPDLTNGSVVAWAT
jgi:hypothetical protein